jgi:hypothetical protein
LNIGKAQRAAILVEALLMVVRGAPEGRHYFFAGNKKQNPAFRRGRLTKAVSPRLFIEH